MTKRKSGWNWGLAGGLIASLCCLGPVVAILLGFSGASFLLGLANYKLYFLGAGAVLSALGIALALRRSKQCCTLEEYRRNRWLIPGVTFASFALSYGLLAYGLPEIAYRALDTPKAQTSNLPSQIPALGAPAWNPTALPAIPTATANAVGLPPGPTALLSTPTAPAQETPLPASATPLPAVTTLRRATLEVKGMT